MCEQGGTQDQGSLERAQDHFNASKRQDRFNANKGFKWQTGPLSPQAVRDPFNGGDMSKVADFFDLTTSDPHNALLIPTKLG